MQEKIYTGYLYNDFLKKFQTFFRLSKDQGGIFTMPGLGVIYSYYTWKDQSYNDFMIQTLSYLEPRQIPKREIMKNIACVGLPAQATPKNYPSAPCREYNSGIPPALRAGSTPNNLFRVRATLGCPH